MPYKPSRFSYGAQVIAWAFMAVGVLCGALVMTGTPALVPFELMVLSVALSGSAGLVLLGLLVILFWGVLGQLLALGMARG